MSATGRREALVTEASSGVPQYVAVLPGPGLAHIVAAIGTAGFFLALAVEALVPAAAFGALALGGFLTWLWTGTDPGPLEPRQIDIGGGIVLPTHATGPVTVSWWAVSTLLVVLGALWACFAGSYLFLWLVNGDARWRQIVPEAGWGLAALALYGAAAAVLTLARRGLDRRGRLPALPMAVAGLLVLTGPAAEGWGAWLGGLRPTEHAHAASAWALIAQQALVASIGVLMAGYVLARAACGLLSGARRLTFDVAWLFLLYTCAQGAANVLLLHGFPRLL
jgi:cytochrome c oxidase subunit I+III